MYVEKLYTWVQSMPQINVEKQESSQMRIDPSFHCCLLPSSSNVGFLQFPNVRTRHGKLGGNCWLKSEGTILEMSSTVL